MHPSPPLAQFNPKAVITVRPLFDGHRVCVIDDFLLNAEEVVDYAREVGQAQNVFRYDSDNYFPGVEMDMGRHFALQFEQYFMLKLRPTFHVRRNLGAACRLSITNLNVEQLQPLQRLCHRDAEVLPAGMGIGASVVYLFDRPELGGTGFFRPRRSLDETRQFLRNAAQASNEQLSEWLQQTASYCHQSNPWFELVEQVEAKWNRAIFYQGTIFHAAHINDADLLSNKIGQARLCLNAFFRYKQLLSAH